MPKERKLVTILFADIVGPTAPAQDHDPEIVRLALLRTFDALREVLAGYGGTVEKFVGDAIMAAFGFPAAHEDDAERAVRSAVALHQKVAELNRDGGLQVQLRVGVNTGDVVAGSGEAEQPMLTGAPVIAAFRLQTVAAPGETLVGALTRRLTEGSVRYGAARGVEAKGLGVLECWPAEALVHDVPDAHRGTAHLTAPLVGRDRELALLEGLLERVGASGAPALVTIFGPAGAGKSRLASELMTRAEGVRVRAGRCLPYGEGITFYPLQLILRAECGIELTDDRSVVRAKLQRAVDEVFEDPEEGQGVAARVATSAGLTRADEALPATAEADLADELRWGVRRFFEKRTAGRPLVLVFEDLHWAEPRLIELIENLAEWTRAPLFILCLARPDFRDEHPAFGAAAANSTTLTLAPLDAIDTNRLITELLGVDALPEALREEIVTTAGGNPLYVEELVRTIIETGRITQVDGRWVAAADTGRIEIPPTLVGLITARLDRVSPDVKRVLQRASLVGRLFSAAGLGAIGDEAVPAELLREAVRRELLSETEEAALGAGRVYRFRHVLIRDVAYATVPKSDRSRLHDNYARWLQTSLGDRKDEIAEIIAFHVEQAFLPAYELGLPTAGGLGPRALAALLVAATRARHRDDPAAARNLYERAADVATLFAADPKLVAEARGFAAVMRWRLEPRSPALDAALDAAYALAVAAGPSEVLIAIIATRAHRANDAGLPTMMNDAYDEAVRVARAVGDPELIGDALAERAWGWYLQGDVDRYEQALVRCRDHLDATASTRALVRCLQGLGRVARIRGDFSAARRYHDAALAALPSGRSKHVQAANAQSAAQIAYDLGDLETAVREGEVAVAAARDAGVPRAIGFATWVLGEVLIDAGEPARARAVLEEAAAIFEARRARSELPEVHGRCARACLRLGELVAARSHVAAAEREVLPTDAEAMQITGIAAAELAEAEGDVAGADARWRDTIDRLLPTGLGKRIAAAQLLYGAFLVRHGRDEDARVPLGAARLFFADPLAYRRVEQIDALLTPLGRRAR
jgi:class 3 adenylate cyclase/tetratricopeptide (TPR) repeat protein